MTLAVVAMADVAAAARTAAVGTAAEADVADVEVIEMGQVANTPPTLGLPSLGVGLGYRPPLWRGVEEYSDKIDFLEIIADDYLDANPRKLTELEALRQRFVLIPHAINLSLGSADGVGTEYLRKLAALICRINPPWWSEHLSFTTAGDVEVGHLCPLPRSREALAVFARNVEAVRSAIDIPLILENITYGVELPGAEMDEGVFLREVVAHTGCQLLLDVTNLYINSVNFGYAPGTVLDALSPGDVAQLHFVGMGRRGEYLIDNHGTAVQEEIWELLTRVLARFAVKGIVLERDQNFPAFGELVAELDRARRIGRECGRWG